MVALTMRSHLLHLPLFVLAMVLFLNQLSTDAQAGSFELPTTVPCETLPPAVRKTWTAIREAALARDYAALDKLADRRFTASFGGVDRNDLVAWWKSYDDGGADIREHMVAILDMPCEIMTYKGETSYIWPSSESVAYELISDSDRAALGRFYGGPEYLPMFKECDYRDEVCYLGFHFWIRSDGRWVAFVAGD